MITNILSAWVKRFKVIQVKQLNWVLLSFILNAFCHAASPVWKVSKGESTLYLGGTVHVLAKSDYPLPEPFNQAYQASTKVIFETDMQQVKTLEFQQAMMTGMMYQDGRTLKTVLSKATYAQLQQFMAERSMPIELFQSFKPSMVMLTLTMAELQRLGLGEAGVDAYFFTKAISDGKQLGELETPGQQLQYLSAMGEGKEDEFISYSLDEMKHLPAMMSEMKAAWVSGDLEQLHEIGIESMRRDFPNMYKHLLVERNNNWMPQLISMLANHEVELVLVGALHLVGEHGLLEQLGQKGYTVQQLN